MAVRYTSEVLIHLRDSPLCVKPANLPPAEEWMGPPTDHSRNNQIGKASTDRTRHIDNNLLEPTNRRTGGDRHASRSNTNPDDIILGPPRTTFTSATLSRSTKLSDNDRGPKDADTRERFQLRSRNVDNDTSDRAVRERDNKANFRRRGDGDQDGEGWSTVKPRNSFGNEGAERFSHRMGERPERRPRDGEDREINTERPRRNFGDFSREKEGTESDKLRRNGPNRNRTENPWSRENNTSNNETAQPRERFDRSKSWRDRTDDQPDTQNDKPKERQHERRWDRDRDLRQEREPEWMGMDEPAEEPPRARNQEEFKKFMELMKSKSTKTEATPTLAQDVLKPQEQPEGDVAKPKPGSTAHTIELGSDKFFAAFGQKNTLDGNSSDAAKESAVPASNPKKGSRFQNFFSSQEQARHQPEPPLSPTAAPPAAEVNPLLAMAASPPKAITQPDAAEKVAFQALLEKLQKQTLQASTPPSGGFPEVLPSQDFRSKNAIASPGHFQQFGQDHRDENMSHMLSHGQDIQAPLPPQNTQYAAIRPEQQMLHDLIGQRLPNQSSGANRTEQPSSRNSNPNTEFLVSLMQSGRNVPDAQRGEQLVMRMPQPSRPAHVPPTSDRDPDFQHERSSLPHQANVRPPGLPNFFDEHLHRQERETRAQPTHILQRPGQGPPGLDQMPPTNWMPASGQQMPAPGRPMIPPPGLPGSQRTGPLPGNYAGFPMGGFPHQDAMAVPPPRNMAPPPGFFGGPPPGFMMHPGMGGFQGPDSLGYGFDGRGMPPPGGAGAPFRRN
ncbi:hypothetical protein GGS21DRAFT_241216 [Xylaria nigripes]|nr:hypothetical protein GGS21DRAFT_241216 [Xylaria nigripes]